MIKLLLFPYVLFVRFMRWLDQEVARALEEYGEHDS